METEWKATEVVPTHVWGRLMQLASDRIKYA